MKILTTKDIHKEAVFDVKAQQNKKIPEIFESQKILKEDVKLDDRVKVLRKSYDHYTMRRYNTRNKSSFRGNNNDLVNIDSFKRNAHKRNVNNTIKIKKIGSKYLNETKGKIAFPRFSIESTCNAPADSTLANRSNVYDIRVISLNKLKDNLKENND